MRAAGVALVLAFVAGVASAQESHLVVIVGLGGEPKYVEAFNGWAGQLIDAARAAGVPEPNIVYLGESESLGRTRSTKENVLGTLDDLAARAGSDDQIVLLVIGHGSQDAGEPRINVPGPDITAADLGRALDTLAPRRTAVVIAASASGGFVETLSSPNRVVVTATRSGGEKYESQFGRYFAEAYASGKADLDHDEMISLLEAFSYAKREVERFYADDNRLATEHPLLDDDGDGRGSENPGDDSTDGALASQTFLALTPRAGPVGDAASNPRLIQLYEEKRALEREIAGLRAAKPEMRPEEYERRLESLLLDLARNTRAITEIEGGGA